jgi:uncharacterized membrane protein YheB (UPF0754 family)
MEIALNEILKAKKAIEKLLNSDLPIKTSYKLSKVIDQLNDEYNKIGEAQRKIMKKYGEEKEGDNVIVSPDKRDEFQKELDDFLKEKTVIDFQPISIEDLGDAKLSAMEVRAMASFFKE